MYSAEYAYILYMYLQNDPHSARKFQWFIVCILLLWKCVGCIGRGNQLEVSKLGKKQPVYLGDKKKNILQADTAD